MTNQKIHYAAGLSNYVVTKDPLTGHKAPRLKDNPGQVHAVYNDARRPAMQAPFFVEDTWDYRAAVCGKLIRVIMPLSFKETEENVCQKCVAKMATVDKSQPLRHEGILSERFHLGWRPRWARRATQQQPTRPNKDAKTPRKRGIYT